MTDWYEFQSCVCSLRLLIRAASADCNHFEIGLAFEREISVPCLADG